MWPKVCLATYQQEFKVNCDNCRKCVSQKVANTKRLTLSEIAPRMIVCPDCGNKRCPKASNHELECSGSNEPGQSGSVYR